MDLLMSRPSGVSRPGGTSRRRGRGRAVLLLGLLAGSALAMAAWWDPGRVRAWARAFGRGAGRGGDAGRDGPATGMSGEAGAAGDPKAALWRWRREHPRLAESLWRRLGATLAADRVEAGDLHETVDAWIGENAAELASWQELPLADTQDELVRVLSVRRGLLGRVGSRVGETLDQPGRLLRAARDRLLGGGADRPTPPLGAGGVSADEEDPRVAADDRAWAEEARRQRAAEEAYWADVPEGDPE